jgi:hypothetical protein
MPMSIYKIDSRSQELIAGALTNEVIRMKHEEGLPFHDPDVQEMVGLAHQFQANIEWDTLTDEYV